MRRRIDACRTRETSNWLSSSAFTIRTFMLRPSRRIDPDAGAVRRVARQCRRCYEQWLESFSDVDTTRTSRSSSMPPTVVSSSGYAAVAGTRRGLEVEQGLAQRLHPCASGKIFLAGSISDSAARPSKPWGCRTRRCLTTRTALRAGPSQISSGGGTRTHNLLVNSQPLCRLSYPGMSWRGFGRAAWFPPDPTRPGGAGINSRRATLRVSGRAGRSAPPSGGFAVRWQLGARQIAVLGHGSRGRHFPCS